MTCKGPKGTPEPKITWKKDGDLIDETGRFSVSETGDLIIKQANIDDTGSYICVAQNTAGSRESNPAHLLVKEKPRFTKSPQDALSDEGNDVQFHCAAEGDPTPTIIWLKEDDTIPPDRKDILDDRSLVIERVKVSDEGIYICRAENSVGSVEALARLTVHSHPTFLVTPQDKVVGVGRTVSLRCEVVGNPPPAVFWSKGASQNYMFPNQDYGRYFVKEDGTLLIEPVLAEDTGEYTCQALSVAGSAFAKAEITVREFDPRPPPIIQQGPQNQTLPVNSVAMLQCHSMGSPQPSIHWQKSNRPINDRDARIAQLDSGTLQISDLRTSDSGVYTCQARSETGETSWSAKLTVEAPSNPNVIFHRTPEPSTFPGSPSKPDISDITERSMTLTWKASTNHGASPVIAYTVEYFSHETHEGWVVASDSIRSQSYTITGLRPGTGYIFIVRARNAHGLGQPSATSMPRSTLGRRGSGNRGNNNRRPSIPAEELAQVKERLSGDVIDLHEPVVISSTAIKLTWDVLKSFKFIEGFHIKYRIATDPKSDRNHRHNEFNIETVDSPHTTMYILRNLKPYTWYDIRVQPYYLTIEGSESEQYTHRTKQDTPNQPPENIDARLVGNSSLHLSWDPPPEKSHNGPLRGFKIILKANETRFHRNITVNASTNSLLIKHLVPGMTYTMNLMAENKMGEGRPSRTIVIGEDTTQMQAFMKEPWFIATLIGTIGGTLWFALCVFSIWLYRKKKARKKLHKSGVMTVPVHKSEDTSRLGNYFGNLNAPNYLQKDIANHVDSLHSDMGCKEKQEENVYNTPHVVPAPMKTFYNKNAAATLHSQQAQPYATTTLAMGRRDMSPPPIGMTATTESAFRPIQNAGHHPSSDNMMHYEDSDNSRPTTDDDPRFAGGKITPGNQPVLILPPPPEHPPSPSELGTPPDSPSLNQRHMMPGIQMGYGTAMIPTSNGMAIMPPGTMYDMNTGMFITPDQDYPGMLPGGFSPPQQPHQPYLSQARTQSLRTGQGGGPDMRHQGYPQAASQARTMSPRSHAHYMAAMNDPNNMYGRSYSPRCMSEPERGPTPPIRAYKLVPIVDNPNGPHYSDNDSAPQPPMRMMHHDPPSPAPEDPMMDRGIQSSLPSIANENQNNGAHDSTEALVPDYEDESDLEAAGLMPRRQSGSQTSSAEDHQNAAMTGSWASVSEQSDATGSSNHSSPCSSSDEDGQFFAEADFASAVAKAAELSGLTVVGSTVMDPNAGRERPKVRKSAKQRERAQRPSSPYSTDSNYSTVPPHKPFPRSERKKQLEQHGHKGYTSSNAGNSTSGHGSSREPSRQRPPTKAKPSPNNHGNLNKVPKPNVTSPTQRPVSLPRDGTDSHLRTNPITAMFDTTDTPIV